MPIFLDSLKDMRKRGRWKILYPVLILTASLQILSKPRLVRAIYNQPISYKTTISATIGEPKLNLFGYAPSDSKVILSGIGVSDTTVATSNGYFEFTRVFLPLPLSKKSLVYPEICLIAVDKKNLTTQPTCIPPLPIEKKQYNVGPVILSPTLQLEKGTANLNETIKAFGSTTPNSKVSIYLAKEREKRNPFSIIKDALAYYIPTYQIESNEHGYFEFSLPTDSINTWRVFASAQVLEANSPKSNTLTFKVPSALTIFIRRLIALLALLRPYLTYFVIFTEVFIILLLARKNRQQKSPEKKVGKFSKKH